MSRILIIEDNIKTAAYLSKGLQQNFFITDVAHDGQEGLFLAMSNQYDLIVIDVMLPQLDGWSVIQKIHQYHLRALTLFLTACDQVDDRVKGLDLGADDYLVKPFAFSEFLARIRSLLRRIQTSAPEILQVADLRIDVRKHKAMRGNQHLRLTAKEFMLLLLLVQRVGEVLSRTLIAEQVWDINFDSDTKIIDVAMKRLRDKVDGEFKKKLIHTIRGVGYVLEERN